MPDLFLFIGIFVFGCGTIFGLLDKEYKNAFIRFILFLVCVFWLEYGLCSVVEKGDNNPIYLDIQEITKDGIVSQVVQYKDRVVNVNKETGQVADVSIHIIKVRDKSLYMGYGVIMFLSDPEYFIINKGVE
jgi:hypothetical protein